MLAGPTGDGRRLFARARVLVGIHGSLLLHEIFSPPGAHVIEIGGEETEMYYLHRAAVAPNHTFWYEPAGDGCGPETETWTLDFGRLERLLARVAATEEE